MVKICIFGVFCVRNAAKKLRQPFSRATYNFGHCHLYLQLQMSFNIVLGQMEKNYISGVKYGLQEWPGNNG